MKQLLISPGQRADVLVQAGDTGTYDLNATRQSAPMGPLARLVVAGEPLSMALREPTLDVVVSVLAASVRSGKRKDFDDR